MTVVELDDGRVGVLFACGHTLDMSWIDALRTASLLMVCGVASATRAGADKDMIAVAMVSAAHAAEQLRRDAT